MGNLVKNYYCQNVKYYLPTIHADFLIGLTIGDTKELDKQTNNNFQKIGLSHIVAVSGSNVAFVVYLFLAIFGGLPINRRILKIISIIILGLFAAVSGFSYSVIRACIMAGLVQLADVIAQKNNAFNSLFVSLGLILITNPVSVYDMGLKLSFLATLGILLFQRPIQKRLKFEILSVTISAQILIIPIQIISFNQLSIMSFLANILIVPIAEIAAIIGYLGFVFPHIVGADYIILEVMFRMANFLAKFKWSTITINGIPEVIWIIYYLICIFFCIKGKIWLGDNNEN